MPHRIRDGLIDYLEVMHLAGVTELGPPRHVPQFVVTPPQLEPEEPQSEEPLPSKTTTRKTPESSKTASSKADRLLQLAGETARCTLCAELALTRTQTVFGVGNPDAELVFLGEAPGADEDKKGEPFVGRAGKLLDDIIVKGMKLRREDVYICNILRCRPPGNRNPTPDEAANCRKFLDATLDVVRPKFICCLGTIAARNLLQTEQTIGALRGKTFDYNGIPVICTYHPAYLLRSPGAKKDTWEDIQRLMKAMELPQLNPRKTK